MGMFTYVEQNFRLEVEEGLKTFDMEKSYIDGKSLYYFLTDGVEIKFFGYWNEPTLQYLDEVGKKGYAKGEFICHYEEGDYIKCKFDETGFHYSMGKTVYEEWER